MNEVFEELKRLTDDHLEVRDEDTKKQEKEEKQPDEGYKPLIGSGSIIFKQDHDDKLAKERKDRQDDIEMREAMLKHLFDSIPAGRPPYRERVTPVQSTFKSAAKYPSTHHSDRGAMTQLGSVPYGLPVLAVTRKTLDY